MAAIHESIELGSPTEQPPQRNDAMDRHHHLEGPASQELKPADRGRDAWTVLIAGFTFEALFWGSCFFLYPNFYAVSFR